MLRLLLIGTLLLATFVSVPSVRADLDTQLNTYLETMLARYGLAGMSVAVVRDGQVVFSRGYGVRDSESGAPATPQTQFSVASITKSMTALAAMRLAEQGKLSLDVPIVEYLPEFTLRNAEHAKTITLRQLLSHTSALPRDDLTWYIGKIATVKDLLTHLATLPMPRAPKAEFAYNNLGYALAGVVLERATGKPYAELLRELVLVPLGMESATLTYADMQKLPDFAAPHRPDVRKGVQRIAFHPHLNTVIAPAGAVNASALDLANYLRFHMGNGRLAGVPILSAEHLRELHTPVQANYGLGWVTSKLGDLQVIWHNGAIDGFASIIAFAPEHNVGVVVLGNTNYSDNPLVIELIGMGALCLAVDSRNADRLDKLTADFHVFDPAPRAERFAKARAFKPDLSQYTAYEGKYVGLIGQADINFRDDMLHADVTLGGVFSLSFELVEFEPRTFVANGLGVSNDVFTIRLSENGAAAFFQNDTLIGIRPPR
ncbi:MAG: serine hydrolase domain-containing protein [Anaerolineae bacterium]|nr:serine hydrolase domain-containing protein [Anaerolineae bacterium]